MNLFKLTANNVMVYMVDATDHVTPETGLTLTLTLSKNGGAFAAITPTVTERGAGWYSVALTASHTDTVGELILSAASAGAETYLKTMNVVEQFAYGMSDVNICNEALARCAITTFISSPSDATKQAQVCNVFYYNTREKMLKAHDWNFASARVALSDLGDPPTNWIYKYAYPTDCVKVRNIIVEGDRMPAAAYRYPFQIAEDNGVKVILCDVENAEIEYTKRITDVSLYTTEFIDVFAWALAAEIMMPLTADYNRFKVAQQMLNTTMSIAKGMNSNEMGEEVPKESEFITARN